MFCILLLIDEKMFFFFLKYNNRRINNIKTKYDCVILWSQEQVWANFSSDGTVSYSKLFNVGVFSVLGWLVIIPVSVIFLWKILLKSSSRFDGSTPVKIF